MIHKNYCHERDCLNFIEIEWDGEFIENWFCEKHKIRKKNNK